MGAGVSFIRKLHQLDSPAAPAVQPCRTVRKLDRKRSRLIPEKAFRINGVGARQYRGRHRGAVGGTVRRGSQWQSFAMAARSPALANSGVQQHRIKPSFHAVPVRSSRMPASINHRTSGKLRAHGTQPKDVVQHPLARPRWRRLHDSLKKLFGQTAQKFVPRPQRSSVCRKDLENPSSVRMRAARPNQKHPVASVSS